MSEANKKFHGTIEATWEAKNKGGRFFKVGAAKYYCPYTNVNVDPTIYDVGDVVGGDYTQEGKVGDELNIIHYMSFAEVPVKDEVEVLSGLEGDGMGKASFPLTKGGSNHENHPVKGGVFEDMLSQAKILVESGLLPQEIKTPAAALAVILTGKELGIPMMQSLRSIYIVKGKPTMSAQLMGSQIFRGGHKYQVKESTNEKCTIEFIRKGDQPFVYTFTLDDAVKAGLTKGDNWVKYPRAMLFSRAMSAGARMVMPDVIAGVYTPDELAERVEVDAETGEQKPVA